MTHQTYTLPNVEPGVREPDPTMGLDPPEPAEDLFDPQTVAGGFETPWADGERSTWHPSTAEPWGYWVRVAERT